MAIHYIVPGTKRKELAKEIGRWLGTEVKYLGMPSCAYRIGCVTLDKEGYFTVESTADEEMVERLIEHIYDIGYESEDYEKVEEKRVCLSLPESSLSEAAEANLKAIIEAKGDMISKALGVSDLPIEHENGKVSFPWLKGDASPDEIQAFQKFVIALCEMARRQKRINACGSSLGVVYGEDSCKPLDSVITICYGQRQQWDNREEAIAEFSEAILASEGSERERYVSVYLSLKNGDSICSDES